MTQKLNLLIDADDTLWENNIYFEAAIAAFIKFLNHGTLSPLEIREVINDVEGRCIEMYGYGLHSFVRALENACAAINHEPPTGEQQRSIAHIAEGIACRPVELIEGVTETLASLHTCHSLILVTKGDTVEQTNKFERSGLKSYFDAIEVLAEKEAASYSALVSRYGLKTSECWMIGNSPKSDINQSLAAGLNAAYIPHSETWVLEHEPINDPPNGQTLLKLERFADLQRYF